MNNKDYILKIKALRENLQKVLRGKSEAIDLAITTLISKGHLLIEDVPGVGKTTLAHALARSVDSSFSRIQFTSDLLPSDVIGLTIYDQRTQSFEFREGPIFSNFILADEINRATPKTQSALLEAMNDRQVSVEKVSHPLSEPFMIIATQNPLEHAGTFPLPESQLDRFTMRIRIGYPEASVEKELMREKLKELDPSKLSPVISASELIELQELVEEVRLDESLSDYAFAITQATRNSKEISLGASPRAAMVLYRAARAKALVAGREIGRAHV